MGAETEHTKPIMPQTVAVVASFQVAEYVRWCESPEETPLSRSMLIYGGRTMHTDLIAFS